MTNIINAKGSRQVIMTYTLFWAIVVPHKPLQKDAIMKIGAKP